jgi:hypothetical protein
MYLETWMLVVLGFVWLYSLYDLWKTGLEHGINVSLNMLEANDMILTDVNENGDKVIHKIVKVKEAINEDE